MITYGRHTIDQSDIVAVIEVLRSGFLTQGPFVSTFEETLAETCGAKSAVAVSNGPAALHLASLAVGCDRDTELLTSPITFVASSNCGLHSGARPMFIDVDPETGNINTDSLQAALLKSRAKKEVQELGFNYSLPDILAGLGSVSSSALAYSWNAVVQL